MPTLFTLAQEVLTATNAIEKAETSRRNANLWRLMPDMEIGSGNTPIRPGRPKEPELLPPNKMPRRRGQTDKARAALLHAVAHIELNAIDLAWDMAARFTNHDLPRNFYDDWVMVGDEEGKHFLLLHSRLEQLGYRYGEFPAHDGLWQAAEDTADDILARLVIVPTVLEARGLDVTPMMIDRFVKMQDMQSADILRIIYQEEVEHVKKGNQWFRFLCDRENLPYIPTWQRIVREQFKGQLKAPFNTEARMNAGLTEDYYLPLTEIS